MKVEGQYNPHQNDSQQPLKIRRIYDSKSMSRLLREPTTQYSGFNQVTRIMQNSMSLLPLAN